MASYSPMKITVVESGASPLDEKENKRTDSVVDRDRVVVSSPSSSEREPSTSPGSEMEPSTSPGTDEVMSETKPKSKTSSKGRRRGCGMCLGCQRDDCGQCYSCMRMVKFGGNGRLKKRCMNRKCQYMTRTPSSDGSLIKKFFDQSFFSKDTSTPDITSSSSAIDDEIITPSSVPSVADESSTGLKRPLSSDSSPVRSVKRRCSPDMPTSPPPLAHVGDESLMSQPKAKTAANEWSGIFKSFNKDPNLVSQTSPKHYPSSPKHHPSSPKCHPSSPKHHPSSPKHHPSSPKHHPSSPKCHPSSPRQFPSPRKGSSLLARTHSTAGSPKKSSSVLFSAYKREDLAPPRDHAPFEDLVHVCQGTLNNKSTGTRLSELLNVQKLLGSEPLVSTGMRPSGFSLRQTPRHEDLLLGTGTNMSFIETKESLPAISGNGLLQQEELLQQMKRNYPGVNIDGIFQRYCTIKSQLDSIVVATERKTLDQVEQNRKKKKKSRCSETNRERVRNGRKGLTLSCSIRVKRDSDGRIKVNVGSDTQPSYSSGIVGPVVVCPPRVNNICTQLREEEPRKRRASFRLAAERLSQWENRERNHQVNKENEGPHGRRRGSDSVSITSVVAPPTQCEEILPLEVETPSFQFGHSLWNDLYHPKMSHDIIGNEEGVAKVYGWLSKWKMQCSSSKDLQERKECQGNESEPVRRSAEMDEEEDPDFRVPHCRHPRVVNMDDSLNLSSCSNEDGEEDEVGVALLLCGPVGCGKTATIYTCAQELGYKVLEINSTHCRTRQSLTSTLREATQSHHVSVQKNTMMKGCGQPPPKQENTNKGLMAFFKPKPTKPVTAKSVEKNQMDETVECNSQVSIATTTLTLLEEVDLLCNEERRGFWSGVYDIVQSTKRPIVFTVNNPQLELPFKHVKVVFHRPTTSLLSVHCQLLALSHDVHVTNETANQIALCAQYDLRKLFNILHFWIATHPKRGGDTREVAPPNNQCLNKIFLDSLSSSVMGIDSRPTTTEQPLSSKLSPLCNKLGLLRNVDSGISEQILPSLVVDRDHTPSDHTPSDLLVEVYKQLDQSVQVCNTLADSDIIMKSHDCYRLSHDLHAPWWNSNITTTSLLDELPHDVVAEQQQQTDRTGDNSYRDCLEASLLLLLAQETAVAAVREPVCAGMETRDSVSPNTQHISEAHDSHMTCCEVFSVHSELDRSSLMAECLPYLHVICKSEKRRETSGLTRRFTHHLSRSEVDIKHLNDFVSKCSYQK